jgi:hypothetical protein
VADDWDGLGRSDVVAWNPIIIEGSVEVFDHEQLTAWELVADNLIPSRTPEFWDDLGTLLQPHNHESPGFGAPKHDKSARKRSEEVSALESGLRHGHHDHSGEFLTTLFAHVAPDRLRESSYCFVDFMVLFGDVLERVHHIWVLRRASSNWYEWTLFVEVPKRHSQNTGLCLTRLVCFRIGQRVHFRGAIVELAACNRFVSRSNLIRRREFTPPGAAMTTVGKPALLGFAQTEHLLSRLPDLLISVCVG